MNQPSPAIAETLLTSEFLRTWPLPMPSTDGDKKERGQVLIIGGSPELPGTMILAANAALRAGAGKVAIATGASIAGPIATAIPEARVIALPEAGDGCLDASAAPKLEDMLRKADAVLIGPGMQNETAVCELVIALLPKFKPTKVVLDAYAMSVVRCVGHPESVDCNDNDQAERQQSNDKARFLGRFDVQALLTPHAGEMAHLTDEDKETIQKSPDVFAHRAAKRWGATVALKGATTCIATPNGKCWRHEGGNIGLAVSGSGDTLAGIIAGLAARGASLEQACAWGVALHSLAGERLAERTGPLGFLIRDLAAEIPGLMHSLRPQ